MSKYGRLYGRWSPPWLAFMTTALSVVFLIAGSIGYFLDKRERFFAGSAWSETVIWWQVGVGIVLVPIAAYFWRRGAADIEQRLISHRLSTD